MDSSVRGIVTRSVFGLLVFAALASVPVGAGAATDAPSDGDHEEWFSVALQRLEELRADAATRPLVNGGSVSAHITAPLLIRQRFTLTQRELPDPHELTIGLMRLQNRDVVRPFTIAVQVNGRRVSTIHHADIPKEQWRSFRIPIARAVLRVGMNEVVLRAPLVQEEHYYAIYTTTAPRVRPDASCQSRDGGQSWDCERIAPFNRERGEGSSYAVQLTALPTTRNVDPEFHYLLDRRRFSLLHAPSDYSLTKLNQYALDPKNTRRLRALKSIPIPGDTDAEKAWNIMDFVARALKRGVNTRNSAYGVLVRDEGTWCAGATAAFVGLAAIHGIDARSVSLVHDRASNGQELGHISAEAWVDGKWVVFDPTYDLSLWRSTKVAGRTIRYGIDDIARERRTLRQEDVRVFRSFQGSARFDYASKLNDIGDPTNGIRFIDYFNDRAVVAYGTEKRPYYRTHQPSAKPPR